MNRSVLTEDIARTAEDIARTAAHASDSTAREQKVLKIGCIQFSELKALDQSGRMEEFETEIRKLKDWVLGLNLRRHGAEGVGSGQLAVRLRRVCRSFNIYYNDGLDTKFRNDDACDKRLSDEQRLDALLSDMRFSTFQDPYANHETALAVGTLLDLCRWRGLV